MKRWLQEPLVHFILLGAVLFVVFGWWSKHSTTHEGSIVVTQGTIKHLVNTFVLTFQRPPTQEEIEGLIQDYVREEVCVREAMTLGLDRDDIIIRRRLRQKLEFVSEDLVAQAQPSDAELQAYMKEHPTAFIIEPRFTFRQVYLNPERHGKSLQQDEDRLLAGLKQAGAKANLATFGDPFMLENNFANVSTREVRSAFGEKFAVALGSLAPGQWQGPVESGYGVHFVYLAERTEGRLPPLEEAREAIRREWANAERVEVSEKFYQALLRRYSVTIERPQLASAKQEASEAQR